MDLSKCGVYKYAEAPDFEILLFGYSIDGGEVKVIDLASGESIPQDVLDALTDDEVTKYAFNANFERVCLSRYLAGIKPRNTSATSPSKVPAACCSLLCLPGVGSAT